MSQEERNAYLGTLDFSKCDDVTKYEKWTKVGRGTFGQVYKAEEKKTRKVVALKKVDYGTDEFPISVLREIHMLQKLKHENIVELIEVCRLPRLEAYGFRSRIYIILQFCDFDLVGLLSNVNVRFTLGEIKNLAQQLFNGLFYVHNNGILHRDMKSANILITKNGVLKLADFGLARSFGSGSSDEEIGFTNRVASLWYRAPELLLGETNYGPGIDMWGAGCIMAELWTRSPIMQGYSEQQQIQLISLLCGSIDEQVWPEVNTLKLYCKLELPQGLERTLRSRLEPFVKDPLALNLLDAILTLDPRKRLDSIRVLHNEFFWTDPLPCDIGDMLSQHTQCMFEYSAPARKVGEMRPYQQEQDG